MRQLKKIPLSQLIKSQTLQKSLDAVMLEHFSITDIPKHFDGTCADLPAATVVFDLAGSSLSIRENGSKNYALEYQNMFRGLSNIIYKHKGIIEKFPGDGISMHFVKFENENAENAIVKALKAIREMDSYLRTEMELSTKQFRFSMSYGDDTIITKIGNEQHNELISIGHAVNVAHKLEKDVKNKNCFIGMDNFCADVCKKEGYYHLNPYNMDRGLRKDPNTSEYWYGVLQ